jgi:eukaryotic-like serine/threonine-protein kinase
VFLDTIDKINTAKKEGDRDRNVSELWYYLAGMAAQTDRRDEAFEYLDKAIEAGYTNVQFMRTDEVLKPLRNDARFDKLVAKAKGSTNSPE